MPSRREILRAGTVAVTAIAVPAGQAAAALHPLSRERFALLVGETMDLTRDGHTRQARLAAVTPIAEGCFILRFTDTAGRSITEGIYLVRHQRLGDVALHIAPTAGEVGRAEAVVNRSAA